MSKDHLALIQFVLDSALQAPVSKRITLYRALADLCGQTEEGKRLEVLAAQLECAEKNCREFAFEFSKQLL